MKQSGVIIPVIFCALWLIPAVVFAADITGYVKSFGYLNPNEPARFSRAGARLQLAADGRIGTQAAYYGAMDFHYDAAEALHSPLSERDDGLSIYPVEAYVELYTEHADFRLGQQFLFWGRTDWVNPTDNINPWDYQNISPEIEDYRIPIMAAKGDLYLGPVTLQIVGIPFFEPDRIPLPVDSVVTPATTLENVQYGLRLSSYFGRLDYSVSYYHGHGKQPAILHQFGPGEPVLYGKYLSRDILGFDFVTTFGAWALKGEAAYVITEDVDGTDPFVDNPFIDSVLGLDYLPSRAVSLTGQLVHHYKFHYREQVEAHNPNGPGPQQTYSTAVRAEWEVMDYVNYSLIGIYNFEEGDFFVLSFFTWDMADAVNITMGGLLFDGPAISPFGRSRRADNLFLELKVAF